jgi:peptidoglycan DL-endopeptidase CwlO
MTTARSTFARRITGPVLAVLAGASILLAPGAASARPHPAAHQAVQTALAQVGDPYVWGAAGPDAFDCSGLVQFSYRAAGVHLPHSSRMQSRLGIPVAKAALQPGDLVFFYHPVRHVGIYVGNGRMVHAPHRGRPVSVVNLHAMPQFNTARRIV